MMIRTTTAALAAILLVAGAADAGLTKGRINETGQVTSYGVGSDGNLRRGLTRIFKDLGNGVVKDSRTGLFWEKKSFDGSIHDKTNTYTWYQAPSLTPKSMNGTMVTVFLKTLNTPPCFGATAENPAGFCDWRIPNRMELESILNLGNGGSATFYPFNNSCLSGCSANGFAGCSCTNPGFTWSSTTVQDTPDTAWHVDFGSGTVGGSGKTASFPVRAVRGGF